MRENLRSNLTAEKLRELDQFLRVRDENMNLVRAHGLLTCLISLPEENYDKIDHYEIFFDKHLDKKYNKYLVQIKETLIDILKTTSAHLSNPLNQNNFSFIFSTAGFSEVSTEIKLAQIKDWCIGYVLGLYWSGMLDAIHDIDRDSQVFGACSTIMFYADFVNKQEKIQHEHLPEINKIKIASTHHLPKIIHSLYTIWSQELYRQDYTEQQIIVKEQTLCPCGSNKQYAVCCRNDAVRAIIH